MFAFLQDGATIAAKMGFSSEHRVVHLAFLRSLEADSYSLRRYPCLNLIFRNIVGYNRAGCNDSSATDSYTRHHNRPASNPDIGTYRGSTQRCAPREDHRYSRLGMTVIASDNRYART